MKNKMIWLITVLLFTSCQGQQNKNKLSGPEVVMQPGDREIVEQIVEIFPDAHKVPAGSLMVKVGTYFQGTPYVAHTLETEGSEKLVVNLREMDCTTFVENCLALTRTLKSKAPGFDRFCAELQKIRYRDGRLNGYESRLHYFSDWIFNNDQKKIVKDVSREIAHTLMPNRVDFMSTHPESYLQLKDDTAMVRKIMQQEAEISLRAAFYIPKNKLRGLEELLRDGDIAGITTNITGLDISHVGILVNKAGRIHLLHASSALGKVVLSEETLEEYLMKSKSSTGIMVARPL